MTLKQIKAGKWYETVQGWGEALAVGGTHPPSVKMRIDGPFPRGLVFLRPREFTREIPDAEREQMQAAMKRPMKGGAS